ncbi:ResB domain-containing protein [Caenorhabditis elegans]|uniref:ResB domain-containing protein n=1 Tax=Caenorhabditis elegans TaxID=6239 RepID=A0A5S9MMV1_CAEEL|nr:ResB domain-containing protein [Caenorhabditis elegans]CAA0059136.1 ResB domain-containing protein [Caenorhabditis elegans]
MFSLEWPEFDVLSVEGFWIYYALIFIGAIACSFVLRWATEDSYDLPAYKNNKRLHFVLNLGDADSLSFYRVKDGPSGGK